ncbi:MAG TPA: nuclear transport factor 2 family protein [Pyrinomonadaceae bacterium]|nr:nuclear transport factor 2 family protein [Pyrinomonadaceae bacterium]
MNRGHILLPMLGMTVVALGVLVSSQTVGPGLKQKRDQETDRQALLQLENDWLANEHNAAKLENILAADFVHPVLTGNFLTKQQHIFYTSKYQPPPNLKHRFGDLTVRVYGDVGIVNGIVITSDESGKDVNKSIFTDVFVQRDGRWQAVNAQENQVENRPPPK